MRSPPEPVEGRGRVVLLASLAATAALAVPLALARWSAGNDWKYFDSLSWVMRSSVLHYGVPPLHDPWACGGVDIAANPQARWWSPLLLLDLLLEPHAAGLATLWLYAFAGFLAMRALLLHLGRDRTLAALGAWLFVGGTWFSLHWSEGHLRFAPMALMPAVALALLRLGEARACLALGALLPWFLLEGAPYAFVYALCLAAAMTVAGLVEWRAFLSLLRRAPLWVLALATSAAATAAGRALPVLAAREGFGRPDVSPLLFAELPRMFLHPLQSRHVSLGDGSLRLHEFGLYLGVAGVPLVLAAVVAPGLARRSKAAGVEMGEGEPAFAKGQARWLAVAALFAWTATGWGGPVNPWTVLSALPLLGDARIPSRFLVLFHLAWVVLLTAAIAGCVATGARRRALVAFLALETLAVTSTAWMAAYAWGRPRLRADATSPLITVREWKGTVESAAKPEHYGRGLGSRACYEPAKLRVAVRHPGGQGYRGEVFVAGGRGRAELLSVTPGEVRLRYEGRTPATVTVNQNALLGWQVVEGRARPVEGRAILTLQVAGEGDIVLRYRPRYLAPSVFLTLAGVAGLALLSRRKPSDPLWQRKPPDPLS